MNGESPSPKRVVGILPAAGLAIRIGGLPKFMLPITPSGNCLLEWHIGQLTRCCDIVVVMTRPENAQLVCSLPAASAAKVMVANTDSMTDTVIRVLDTVSADFYLVGMPDTYFVGDEPYAQLADPPLGEGEIRLATWQVEKHKKGAVGQVLVDHRGRVLGIRDKDHQCDYPYLWGAIGFSPQFRPFLDASMPTIGCAIDTIIASGKNICARPMRGKYFDCGTVEEYARLLGVLFE